MGKSKNRLFGRKQNLNYKFDMTRHQAIDFVVNEIISRPSSIRAKDVASLFGLQTEELTEAGMKIEQVAMLERCYSLM